MELKEFINNTLMQIAEGVQEAIDNSKGKGFQVSQTDNEFGRSCSIHFDIAVESEAEGNAGIKVVGGGISKRSANRISFDLTMILPCPQSANVTIAHKRTENYLAWKKNCVAHQDNHEARSHPVPDK